MASGLLSPSVWASHRTAASWAAEPKSEPEVLFQTGRDRRLCCPATLLPSDSLLVFFLLFACYTKSLVVSANPTKCRTLRQCIKNRAELQSLLALVLVSQAM